jgi:uncharacterized protein
MIWTLLILWLICWMVALYCVYQGGRTFNDHIVALFVTLCMIVYPIWWVICPYDWLVILLAFGPMSMTFLFVMLLRRQEVHNRILFSGLYLSQIGYGLSLFGWGICFPWYGIAYFFEYSFWNDWIFGCTSVCTIWGVLYTYIKYEHVNRYHLGNLGIRIAHLSDIHISPTMTEVDLNRLIEKVNALSPDILLATGDFVMPFSESNHDHLYTCLQKSTAPVFACLGNHDLPVRERMIRDFEAHEITMLVDEFQKIQCKGHTIFIGGLDFLWKEAQKHSENVINNWSLDDVDYKILMVHDPRYFAWLPSRFDLVCAGHTHGGQFGLNALGLPISLLRPMGVYDQGFFEKETMKLYVHKGNWHTGLPPRIGIAAEIAIFDI